MVKSPNELVKELNDQASASRHLNRPFSPRKTSSAKALRRAYAPENAFLSSPLQKPRGKHKEITRRDEGNYQILTLSIKVQELTTV